MMIIMIIYKYKFYNSILRNITLYYLIYKYYIAVSLELEIYIYKHMRSHIHVFTAVQRF